MNMQNRGFKSLKVYQKAYQFALDVYTITKDFPKEEKYSLTDQIRRSSRSICTNIAEAYRIGGGIVIDVAIHTARLTQLETERSSIIVSQDKGKTMELLNDISNNIPAGNLKNKLLANFPLSDTVLSATLLKPQRLPNGHIKEILISNAPMSDHVFGIYENYYTDMPNGIDKQIRKAQVENSVARTLTAVEREINVEENLKQQTLNLLFEYYLQNNKTDSIKILLEAENTNYSKELLIGMDISDSNYAAAINRLTNYLPENIAEQQWKELMAVELDILQQGEMLYKTDSTTKTYLLTLAYSEGTFMAKTMAQNILRLLYGMEFENEMQEVVSRQSAVGRRQEVVGSKQDEGYLGDNIPNPFEGTTLIPYHLPEGIAEALLVISDTKGKTLESYTLTKNKEFIEIKLSGYSSGVYFYKLVISNETLQTKRMILIKK